MTGASLSSASRSPPLQARSSSVTSFVEGFAISFRPWASRQDAEEFTTGARKTNHLFARRGGARDSNRRDGVSFGGFSGQLSASAECWPLIAESTCGEVQEWLNWQHWKCCVRGTVPWVRIPPSPPDNIPDKARRPTGNTLVGRRAFRLG